MGAQPAVPKFSVGDTVAYFDHTGRPQVGTVKAIEANWGAWRRDPAAPSICYTVTHPSYRGHRMYASEGDLRTLAIEEPTP